ncbi:MAG: hypothetical protein NT006_09965 [Candidatus Aminicenantes bacterium]|nr:hypothetical protein [Candidatus Aminicenantes bacterium]
MSCDKFERYGDGAMSVQEFARHVQDCPGCREQAALDARLDREIVALRKPLGSEGLWKRIETSLRHEKEITAARDGKRASGGLRLSSRRWAVLAPAGAALLALAVLGILVFRKPFASSGILTREALARVEIKEKEYLEAIEMLAQQARPRIAAMGLQMTSLYRDKLAMIDAQIEKCREALDSNPANAHIRRYLLAALQDKRQALADVLGSMN